MSDLHFTTDHGPTRGDRWAPIAQGADKPGWYSVVIIESGDHHVVAVYSDDEKKRPHQWVRHNFLMMFTRVL